MVKGMTLICLMLLIAAIDTPLRSQFVVKAGVDLAGSHKASFGAVSEKEDTKTAFTISGEYLTRVNTVLKLGGGLEYQLPREVRGFQGRFDFVSLFAAAKTTFGDRGSTLPYLHLRLGYNFYSGDSDYRSTKDFAQSSISKHLSDGFYYALGAGVEMNRFLLDLSYSANSGTFTLSDGVNTADVDITYAKLNFSIGYSF